MEKIPYFAGPMPVADNAARIRAGTLAPGVRRK